MTGRINHYICALVPTDCALCTRARARACVCMYFDCELYYKWFIERNNSNTKGIYLTKFPQPRTRLVGCFYSSGIIRTPYIYYVLCIYYIRYSRWLAQSRFIISRLIYYCLKKKPSLIGGSLIPWLRRRDECIHYIRIIYLHIHAYMLYTSVGG